MSLGRGVEQAVLEGQSIRRPEPLARTPAFGCEAVGETAQCMCKPPLIDRLAPVMKPAE
jgi:hypothetical protein